jgi:hypothetical protein
LPASINAQPIACSSSDESDLLPYLIWITAHRRCARLAPNARAGQRLA